MFTDEINARVTEIAAYVAESGATVRAAAQKYGISKSTVHKDLTERLKYCDGELFRRVEAVLAKNRAERHLRGGMATRLKYRQGQQEVDKAAGNRVK